MNWRRCSYLKCQKGSANIAPGNNCLLHNNKLGLATHNQKLQSTSHPQPLAIESNSHPIHQPSNPSAIQPSNPLAIESTSHPATQSISMADHPLAIESTSYPWPVQCKLDHLYPKEGPEAPLILISTSVLGWVITAPIAIDFDPETTSL